MTFVPASSWAPATVAIGGTVDVSDRAGRLLGHTTVDNASLAVTGPLTDAQFAARLPLTVGVNNFPADQLVHFAAVQHVIVDSGSISVGNFPADQLVHWTVAGPVTQGTSPWVTDGSATTQPVSGPLTSAQLAAAALATEGTLDRVKRAVNDMAEDAMIEKDGVMP